MRIGIIGCRYPKGIGIVNESIAALCESLGHKMYFLSYPLSHRKACLTTGEWKRDNVTIINTFHRTTVRLSDENIATWVAANKLNVVITIEEPRNENLFKICKTLKVATINFNDIEMFNPDLKEMYQDCALFMCPTQICYNTMLSYGYQNIMLVKYMVNIYKFPWIQRKVTNGEAVQFIMHAGWGGSNGRKGVEATIRAFVQANHPNTQLYVLTQKKWKTYDEKTRKLVNQNKRIRIQEINNTDVVYNTGAYTFGHVTVAPSKWEGLGLPHIESLVSGMPVVTCNAAPMNEFVEHEKTGLLVDADIIAGETIQSRLRVSVSLVNEEALAQAFIFFGDNPNYVEAMSCATEQVRSKYEEYKQSFSDMLKRFE